MQFKLVAVLLPFCLFQAILCSSITPEDRIKLIIAEDELILIIKKTAIEINLVEDVVNNQIKTVEHEIKHSLKELKEEVKDAEKEAEISGKDIQICVNAEKVSSKALDDSIQHSLRDCKNTIEMNEIELELNQLRNLQDYLLNGEATCEVEVDASKCVDVLIEDVNENRDGLADSILKLLQTVDVDAQFECITIVNGKLNNVLANIVNEWRNCINEQ